MLAREKRSAWRSTTKLLIRRFPFVDRRSKRGRKGSAHAIPSPSLTRFTTIPTYMTSPRRPIGLIAWVAGGLFPCLQQPFGPARSPRCDPRLQSERPVPPQSTFTFDPPSPIRRRLAYPGFWPSSRPPKQRPLIAEGPKPPLRSVLGLLRPSTVCSATSFHELVRARDHVQGSPRPGASLAAQRPPARRRVLPPCR